MSELPQGWVETTLGDLYDVTSSKRVHQHEWTKEGVPFYRAREIKKLARAGSIDNDLFISEELFEKYSLQFGSPVFGDLMVTAVGTLGECYQVTEEDRFYFKDASVLWFRKQTAVETDFVAKLFLSKPILDQVHKGGGTTVGTYTVAAAKGTVVPLPPLPEQRRIVAKIDSLTGKSKRARDHLDHIPRLVEKYKQAVLAAAFRGELTGSTSADLAPLGDFILALDQGWSPKCEPEPAAAGEWAVIKTTAIQPVEFIAGENKRLPAHLSPRPEITIHAGDVLVTRAGPRSRVAISCVVAEDHPRLMLCDKAYRLRVDKHRADPVYLAYILNSPQCLSVLEAMKTGISDSGLNLTQAKFLELPVPVFPKDIQVKIVDRVRMALNWIDRLASEATSARRLIDRLDQAVLAKAFRGALVPQEPDDEPASVLLDRIKAERGAAPKSKRQRSAVAPV